MSVVNTISSMFIFRSSSFHSTGHLFLRIDSWVLFRNSSKTISENAETTQEQLWADFADIPGDF